MTEARGAGIFTYISGQIIATSAEVTLNGGLVRELPQNPLNSGLGIILICPDIWLKFIVNVGKYTSPMASYGK